MAVSVSPFSFVTYTSDNQSIVVAIPTDPTRYYVLLEIDGIEADDIIHYAQEHGAHKDDKNVEDAWAQDLAAALPAIIAAVAEEKGINPATTYPVTKKAKVLLSDINTCEVEEVELAATAEAYAKAAETAQTRADHQDQQQSKKKAAAAAAGAGAAAGAEGEDEEEYEDVEDEEEEEEEEESDERKAYMAQRRKLEMLSTQLEAAIGLANELGASFHQIEATYIAAQGPGGSLPASTAECEQLAKGNPVLEAFLHQIQHSMGMDQEEGDDGMHMHGGPGGAEGMPPGMDPRAAAAAGQQCQQQ